MIEQSIAQGNVAKHTVGYNLEEAVSVYGVSHTAISVHPPLREVGPAFTAAVIGQENTDNITLTHVGTNDHNTVFDYTIPEKNASPDKLKLIAERVGILANNLRLHPQLLSEDPFAA